MWASTNYILFCLLRPRCEIWFGCAFPQTFKKLQAVLADIFIRVEYPVSLAKDIGRRVEYGWLIFKKVLWGKRMKNGLLRIQNIGRKAEEWGLAIQIWEFHHATPTFNTQISGEPLSRITQFCGHCCSDFPLGDNLHLFPGLFLTTYHIRHWTHKRLYGCKSHREMSQWNVMYLWYAKGCHIEVLYHRCHNISH